MRYIDTAKPLIAKIIVNSYIEALTWTHGMFSHFVRKTSWLTCASGVVGLCTHWLHSHFVPETAQVVSCLPAQELVRLGVPIRSVGKRCHCTSRASNSYLALKKNLLITSTDDDLMNYVSGCLRLRSVESLITETNTFICSSQ